MWRFYELFLYGIFKTQGSVPVLSLQPTHGEREGLRGLEQALISTSEVHYPCLLGIAEALPCTLKQFSTVKDSGVMNASSIPLLLCCI